MTHWLKKIHKWLGLLIGLQLLLWMLSGFVMSLLDADQVRGSVFRAPPPARAAWPANAVPVGQALRAAAVTPQSVSTGWLAGEPVYRLSVDRGVRLISALSGSEIVLDAALARRLAQDSYRGPGQAGQAELVEASLETRAHEGPVWRVAFSDREDTTVYLSRHGDVLEHRNSTWRAFDIFWMLHIMDYSGRKDFNNPLVVSAAVAGLWLSLSGVWLLFTSFRLAEFLPRRWRAGRTVQVTAPDGSRLRTLRVAKGETIFVALAREGMQLPSNCGGGQSCGLCEVKVRGTAPPATPADEAQLAKAKLRDGHRLACNLAVVENMDVEVPGGTQLWTAGSARVRSVTALSPTLREIVLTPDKPITAESHRPGSYLQIQVPRYDMALTEIEVPPQHKAAWSAWRLPSAWSNPAPLRRSYSLAAPVAHKDGTITLLVRFMPGPADAAHHPPGRGSSYMYRLGVGDRVEYTGPFGDFALQPGRREKVFIGGGAGMAPLRAMLRARLEDGADEPMHFWYGARSEQDVPYAQEMQTLAQQHANFGWHVVLSGDETHAADSAHKTESADKSSEIPPSTPSPRGMVHDAAREWLSNHPDLHGCEFYLCGPPAMLAATRRMLRRLGVAEDRIALDDFKI